MTPLALITNEYNIILKSTFDYFMKPELKKGTKVETKQIITFESSFTLIFTL